jgi:hypothetical protein
VLGREARGVACLPILRGPSDHVHIPCVPAHFPSKTQILIDSLYSSDVLT